MTERTQTTLGFFAKCIDVRLPGGMVAHGLTRPEPHRHEDVTQRLRSDRVLAQVSCPNAQLDELLP